MIILISEALAKTRFQKKRAWAMNTTFTAAIFQNATARFLRLSLRYSCARDIAHVICTVVSPLIYECVTWVLYTVEHPESLAISSPYVNKWCPSRPTSSLILLCANGHCCFYLFLLLVPLTNTYYPPGKVATIKLLLVVIAATITTATSVLIGVANVLFIIHKRCSGK
jgi:hypothetical protein